MSQRPMSGDKYYQPDVQIIGMYTIGEDPFPTNRALAQVWVGKTDADVSDDTTWTNRHDGE